MSSKELYKRFISLCKKWPRDDTKVGRDYGDFFRQHIKKEFPHEEQSSVSNPVALESAISSLERLANNNYFNENPLKRSSATGVEAWACRSAVSNEGLRAIQEQEESSLIKKLKKSLNVKFVGKELAKTDSETEKTKTAPLGDKDSPKQQAISNKVG